MLSTIQLRTAAVYEWSQEFVRPPACMYASMNSANAVLVNTMRVIWNWLIQYTTYEEKEMDG